MPYTKHEERTFSHSSEELFKAVKAAAAGLEGKIILEEQEARQIHIQFHKTIHGNVLGDRTVFQVQVQEADGKAKIMVG